VISACVLTKNDEDMIARVLDSVKPFVQELLVIDDGSIDNTQQAAVNASAKVLPLKTNIGALGFAEAANEMISYATQEYILIIDSDELLGLGHLLQTLTRFQGKDAWALPRRKWTQYPNLREEYEAYPDWQVRFFKRAPNNKFTGQMHVRFQGSRVYKAYNGPIIEHLQRECRTPAKEIHRAKMYETLAKLQGVFITGGRALEKQ